MLRPPVTVARSGNRHADVAALTQAIAEELEELIAAAPTQWHLMQPNWPVDRGHQRMPPSGRPGRARTG